MQDLWATPGSLNLTLRPCGAAGGFRQGITLVIFVLWKDTSGQGGECVAGPRSAGR